MSQNPPQTLSVKRKRTEHPVESLIVEGGEKRQKSDTYAWRLVSRPDATAPGPAPLASPVQPNQRQFHVSFSGGNRVLVEARAAVQDESTLKPKALAAPPVDNFDKIPIDVLLNRPLKRPGRSAAVTPSKAGGAVKTAENTDPSEEKLRQFEAFSQEVEKIEVAQSKSSAAPLNVKPKVPALRYRDRHPEKAAALEARNPATMDLDDFVIDTYVREVIVPDAEGKLPELAGTVGLIVLKEEDEDWWNGDEDSDKEFATDDEDENAEDYYANDYPEDELSSDDEFDRNLYQHRYRRGSVDEEYGFQEDDAEDARSDGDEDDEHFRRIASPRPTYWGRIGE